MDAAETILDLEPRHVEALDKAETWVFHASFCPYLELKSWLGDTSPDVRERFREYFTQYYGLNIGGLTDDFKNKYFEIMFGGDVWVNGQPDYAGILNVLSTFKMRTGYFALPFSFVSKLVAMHSEDCPIYDRHVLEFFGGKVPSTNVSKADRIAWFVRFLTMVRRTYEVWADDERILPVLNRLKARDKQLPSCHVVRLMDFLVWTVGNRKLLTK